MAKDKDNGPAAANTQAETRANDSLATPPQASPQQGQSPGTAQTTAMQNDGEKQAPRLTPYTGLKTVKDAEGNPVPQRGPFFG